MKSIGILAFGMAACSVAILSARGPRGLTITYHSDPAGATLYANENQQTFGYAPVKLKYKVTKGFSSGKECMTIQPVMVRWASGAEASVSTITACPQQGGNQQFTLVRPTGVEGRELDVQFALQLQQIALLRQQARAAQSAAFWQNYAATLDRIREQNRILRCTSNVIGSFVYTNCY